MINAIKKEFEKNLKIVYKLLRDIDSTNNIQLNRLCNELFGSKFYGVYPSDKIPNLNFHKKYHSELKPPKTAIFLQLD
jgi:hypothetical protein